MKQKIWKNDSMEVISFHWEVFLKLKNRFIGIWMKRINQMNNRLIYQLIRKIPKGRVSTYKAISVVTGIHPRAVGMILHVNPDPVGAPCYKIIKSDGSLGGYGGAGGVKKKIELLKKDGIKIRNGKVDLKKYLHEF